MREKEIAKAYARSVIELSDESKVDIAKELTDFTEMINGSNDLENLLFLDIFTLDEKNAVLNEVFSKTSYSSLTKNFVAFLAAEKRLGLFPLVFKEVIVIDDDRKGFLRGTIEGADEAIDEASKKKLQDYLEGKLGKKTNLSYKKSQSVTAGFRVTVEDLQLDATLDNQFDQFKNTVTGINS